MKLFTKDGITLGDSLTVEVSSENIRDGWPEDRHSCMLALALCEFLETNFIGVRTGYAKIDAEAYGLDSDTMRNIRLFDTGNTVEPFTATLTKI